MLVLLPAMLVYLWGAWCFGDWLVDDAGITFAYATRLADGLPLSVNLGEAPVEGYSNPSWMFLCAVMVKLGLFVLPATPKIATTGLVFLGMYFALRVSRDAWGTPESLAHALPVVLMAGTGTFVQWTTSGLENALYTTSILAALWAHVRVTQGRAPVGLDGALAVLVAIGRPEGPVYLALFGLDRVLRATRERRVRPLAAWAVAVCALGGTYVGWHLTTFEDLLPNTYYAKLGEGGLSATRVRFTAGWEYLCAGLSEQGIVGFVAVGLGALLTPRAAWRSGAEVLPGAALCCALAVCNTAGDWMGGYRFLTPMYPLVGLAASGSLLHLGARLPARVRDGLVLLGIGAFASTTPASIEHYVQKSGMRLLVQLGALNSAHRWAEELGMTHAVVGLADVGGAAIMADPSVTIVDLFGLTDRRAARLLHAPGAAGVDARAYLFEERRLDFVRLVEPNFVHWHLGEGPEWERDYLPVQTDDERRPARRGNFIRRDLVSGPPPADLELAPVGGGLTGAVQMVDGQATLWWEASEPQATLPRVAITWEDASGGALKTEKLAPFHGKLGAQLFAPGLPLFQRWRGELPAGTVAGRMSPG